MLRAYKRRLFTAGVPGVYSFPLAVPLAAVSHPFTPGELKTTAHSVRELSAAFCQDGKIALGKPVILTCPSETLPLSFFGLSLDAPPPDFSQKSVQYRFPSLLVCTALVSEADQTLTAQDGFPAPPSCCFRAGMIANMVFRPLETGDPAYSFEWKTGVPVWLPAYKRT
jgi:hypothetical protein